jgi:hypothetical protein
MHFPYSAACIREAIQLASVAFVGESGGDDGDGDGLVQSHLAGALCSGLCEFLDGPRLGSCHGGGRYRRIEGEVRKGGRVACWRMALQWVVALFSVEPDVVGPWWK